MYSYNEILSKFNRMSTSKLSYRIANNTEVIKWDNEINCTEFGIRLHGNLIARLDYSSIILYTAGWYTFTTKSRLNDILQDNNIPFKIYQENYKWYIWGNYNGNYPTNDYRQNRMEFYNGITFVKSSNQTWIIQ